MPVDDRTRLNLHRKLDAVLGPEEADTLMAHLPPVTWNDVATKDDLHVLERTLRSEFQAGFAELRGEMHALDAGLRGEIAGVRGELHALDAGLRGEIAGVRGELHALDAGLRGEIAGVRGELHALDAGLRGEIANAITTQTKWMVTFAAAWSTLLITAVRLLP